MTDKTVAVRLLANITQYQAAMVQAAAATRSVTGGMGAMARTTAANQKALSGFGRDVGLINPKLVGAAGLAYGLKTTASAAIDWESAFAGVRKTVDATETELAGLERGLRNMAMQIPVAATELAGIGEAAGQLGIKTENIEKFTRVMADLGVATNLSGEQAATTLARLANITQMSQDDFDRLGSTIVHLGNNLETTEAEIADMALRLAGAANVVGLSEADILGLAGALSSVGLRSEEAGSSISRVLMDMQTEVETGGEKLAGFAEVAGMSADEFARAFRDDAAGAFNAFVMGLGRVVESGEGATQILDELSLSDVRVTRALLNLAGSGDKLTESLDLANGAWADNVALAKEAAQRYGTTESKMRMAKNAVNELKIGLGEGLTPAIGAAADALNDFLSIDVRGTPLATTLGEAFVQAPGGLFQMLNAKRANTPGWWDDLQRGALSAATFGIVSPFAADPTSGYTDRLAGQQDQARQNRADEAASARLQGLADRYNGVNAAADQAARKVAGFATAQEELSHWVELANGEIAHQVNLLREQYADPVLDFVDAVGAVQEAQAEWTKTVEEHGAESTEAAHASRAVFEALLNLQVASDSAAGRFGDVNDMLAQMRQQGLLTGEQADALAGLIAAARSEAEQWEGTYTQRLETESDTSGLEQIIAKAAEAVAALRSVGRAASLTGSGAVVHVNRGPGGITSFHGGGEITSATPGWLPGMRPDERLIKAQVGETVLPAGAHVTSADQGGGSRQLDRLAAAVEQLLTRSPNMFDIDLAVTTDTRRAGEHVMRHLRDLEEAVP